MRTLFPININKWFCIPAIILFAVNLHAQRLPFQDPNLSSEERAKDLITKGKFPAACGEVIIFISVKK